MNSRLFIFMMLCTVVSDYTIKIFNVKEHLGAPSSLSFAVLGQTAASPEASHASRGC